MQPIAEDQRFRHVMMIAHWGSLGGQAWGLATTWNDAPPLVAIVLAVRRWLLWRPHAVHACATPLPAPPGVSGKYSWTLEHPKDGCSSRVSFLFVGLTCGGHCWRLGGEIAVGGGGVKVAVLACT